ncbi:MAG: CDP-glycerol glycerophosphotransferase family protein [Luteimonas sp.]
MTVNGSYHAVDPLDTEAAQLQADVDLLIASGLFDADYYLDNNPDVATSGIDPLQHFCKHGWRELRKPCLGFDVWWYWVTYLDPTRESINPFVHYVQVGQYVGHSGQPEPYAPGAGHAYGSSAKIRRICLFAGYDPSGVVDDYVVAFLQELSRFADIYYLADCAMRDGELDKLRPYTVECWAYRHGAYDFGSWSALAKAHVGWSVIEQYDELILANDSSYLLTGLGPVFAKMDRKACDWWGMQATKGLACTRTNESNQFSQPIPMDEVRAHLVDRYEEDYLYDFHVGSYFLVYRQPVIRDVGYQRQLDAVQVQKSKLRIIQKYEIGFTHYLIGKQFKFDTFIDFLYPFHPIYTRRHFDLIREGYPFLKRYFLSENHYDTPGLASWKDTVRSLVPDAPVEMMERNLLRVADDDKLQRSFRITTAEDGSLVVPTLLEGRAFAAADVASPKFDHWWAFPVCAFDHGFAGNERAVFEEVRNDPSIRKIVLTRGKRIELEGENVVVVPLKSPEGQHYLLRSRQIFVKHGPRINVPFPLSPKLHNFINLWHGIPLKRFGYASLDMVGRLKWVADENRGCRAVISSSKVDTLAMAAAFYPLSYRDIWPTGLPRNDFVLCPPERLPADLRQQEQRLRDELRGRRLVLFLPTFKNAQEDGYYRFSGVELATLGDWLERNHAVLGVREHMADMARTYATMLAPLGILDLSSARYPNVEVLYRVGAALVTDYSSCVIDFMLTGRPVISFAYDYDNYANAERGLFYDLEFALPGPVCRDFGQLTEALETVFDVPDAQQQDDYAWKRSLFFDHCDDGNAWRLVTRVKNLYIGSEA